MTHSQALSLPSSPAHTPTVLYTRNPIRYILSSQLMAVSLLVDGMSRGLIVSQTLPLLKRQLVIASTNTPPQNAIFCQISRICSIKIFFYYHWRSLPKLCIVVVWGFSQFNNISVSKLQTPFTTWKERNFSWKTLSWLGSRISLGVGASCTRKYTQLDGLGLKSVVQCPEASDCGEYDFIRHALIKCHLSV